MWVVHAVADPARLFREVARVVRPGGRYVVCATQQPADDDTVGNLVAAMTARVDAARDTSRPRTVTTEQVLEWARSAGFAGTVHELHRTWRSRPSDELAAIEARAWPTLRMLDDATVEKVTRPTVAALRALPDGDGTRRAVATMIVLER